MFKRLLGQKKSESQGESLTAVVRRYQELLYGNAIRLTHNEADARDLVQETFLRAHRAWEKFDQKNTRAWLLKIQYHCFVNLYHKKKREQSQRDGRELDLVLERKEEQVELCLPQRVDRDFLGHFLGGEVMEALDELRPEYRMAVLLSDFHGLPYREIADILECPVGTVMSRLHRGRQRLQQALFEEAKAAGLIPSQIVDIDAYRTWKAAR